MPEVSPPELLDYVERILVAAGAPDQDAAIVAAHLVEANLKGHDSHGVVRVPEHVEAVRSGIVQADGHFTVEKQSASTALIDGGWGFGQVVARRATRMAIEMARATGVGVVSGRRVAHVGRLGAYAEQAVEAGKIGLVASSGSPLMAAHGGTTPRLSTNPIAIGVPTADEGSPFVLDMATSVVAAGNVRLAQRLDARIPEGWLVDASGAPTTDPAALSAGALLPLGGAQGYKGFGLALAIEALASLLGGSAPSGPDSPPDVGLFVLVFDPDHFAGRASLGASMSTLIEWVKQPPYQPGVSEILVPGERAQRSMEERALAIPLDASTWAALSEAATSLGVVPPSLEPPRRRHGRDAEDDSGA
ncbi:MAG: Ldh family oxidoreductase [Dehalococcoidia bacterium]